MIFLMIFFAVTAGLICRWFYKLVKRLRKDVSNNQMQLGDHYEYAAWLCERIDNMGWFRGSVDNLGYRLDEMESLVREHIADTRDALTVLDDATDVIRYGLMEHGGFVRNENTFSFPEESYVHSRASELRHVEHSAKSS